MQVESGILHGSRERGASTFLRLVVVVGLCVLVFGAVFGVKWFSNRMMNQVVDAMPVPPATISSAPARPMTWVEQLEAIGTLVPVNGADVTTEIGGIVTDIHFESGQKVSKGAPLITLDSSTERGEVKRLKAQAELAELNRARREKLFRLEAISKSDYDAAVSEASAAQAALESQTAVLGKKDIRAPFDGLLGIRRVNVGQYLQPGTAMVTLQALDPIDIDFSLPEQRLGAVGPDYPVEVRVDALPQRAFAGKVLAVEPRVDTATRNFNLRARLPNPELLLRAGQSGKVLVSLPEQRQFIVVPRTAIAYASYGTSVYLVQKQPPKPKSVEEEAPMPGVPQGPKTDLEVVQRFVKLGESRGDFVAVIEGLKEGEVVATSGLLKLRNHQPVIINNDMAPKVELNPTPVEN